MIGNLHHLSIDPKYSTIPQDRIETLKKQAINLAYLFHREYLDEPFAKTSQYMRNLTKLASVMIRMNDMRATTFLPQLDKKNKGRIQKEIVKWSAEKNYEFAMRLALKIQDPQLQSEALLEVVKRYSANQSIRPITAAKWIKIALIRDRAWMKIALEKSEDDHYLKKIHHPEMKLLAMGKLIGSLGLKEGDDTFNEALQLAEKYPDRSSYYYLLKGMDAHPSPPNENLFNAIFPDEQHSKLMKELAIRLNSAFCAQSATLPEDRFVAYLILASRNPKPRLLEKTKQSYQEIENQSLGAQLFLRHAEKLIFIDEEWAWDCAVHMKKSPSFDEVLLFFVRYSFKPQNALRLIQTRKVFLKAKILYQLREKQYNFEKLKKRLSKFEPKDQFDLLVDLCTNVL